MKKFIYFFIIPILFIALSTGTPKNLHKIPIAQAQSVVDITQKKPTQFLASNTASKGSAKIKKYTVKSGDTFSKIALITGVSASKIIKANNLSAKTILKIGQILIIPSATSKTPAAKVTTSKPAAKKTTTSSKTVSSVTWTAGALAELRKIPSFVRPSVKVKITNYAKSHGIKIITVAVYKSIHV